MRPEISGYLGYWTNLTDTLGASSPSQRYGAALAYDTSDGYIVLFGGAAFTPSFTQIMFGDTWIYSNGTWTQLVSSGPAPSSRWAGCMDYVPSEQGVILFGGLSSATSTGGAITYIMENDTWLYSHGNWTNLTATLSSAPPPREAGYCDYDAAYGGLVMFGGTNGPSYLSDTWAFKNGAWTNLTASVSGAPPPIAEGGMAFDPADSESVLYGGVDASGNNYPGTWTFSNLTWTNITSTAGVVPTSTTEPGLAYDPALSAIVEYGGFYPAINSTMLFSNGSWTNVTLQVHDSMGGLSATALMYEPNGGYILAFGGVLFTPGFLPEELNATWAFGQNLIPLGHPVPSVIDLGQTVNLTVETLPGTSTYGYAWSGAGCPNLNRSSVNCTPSSVGNHSATVTVNDSSGESANYTYYYRVNPDVSIMNFTVIPEKSTVGYPVKFFVSVANGTPPYRFVYSNLPPGCSSMDTAALGCTPNATGVYAVQVEASDVPLFGQFSNLTLTVNPALNSATVTARPAILDVGQMLTLNSSFQGGTPPEGFVWSGLPPGCQTVNASSLTCVPTDQWTGIASVVITDADGNRTSAGVNVVVNPQLVIVQLVSRPGTADVGTPFTVWGNVSGGTGVPHFLYGGLPPGCGVFLGGLNNCTPSSVGTYDIVLNVTDEVGASTWANLTLVVNPPLQVLSLLSGRSALDVGQNTTLTTTLSGGTSPVVLSYSGLPLGCTSRNSPTIDCVPAAAGTSHVTVTASDAAGAASAGSVSLEVFSRMQLLGVEVFGAPAVVGSPIHIVPQVTGGSGGLTFAYSQLPTGCSSGNLSNLSCSPAEPGNYTVGVTVTDTAGAMVQGSVQFDVSSSPASSSGGFPVVLLLVGALVAVAVAGVVGGVLWRRRQRSRVADSATDSNPEDPT